MEGSPRISQGLWLIKETVVRTPELLVLHQTASPHARARLHAFNPSHTWQCIRSIVCLNLPSFSGGLNPWGTPNTKKQCDRDLTPPFVDDGLLEIVGFRDAWHGLVLLCPNGHGTRLAQAHRIRFEFHKGAADHTYMRIDGEPWKQPLPVDDDTVVVEISHHGQVQMLATPKCIAKSVHDQLTPTNHDVDGEDRSDDEYYVAEEQRKFGAADTFKIPYEERNKGKESSSS